MLWRVCCRYQLSTAEISSNVADSVSAGCVVEISHRFSQ